MDISNVLVVRGAIHLGGIGKLPTRAKRKTAAGIEARRRISTA